jgi:hypothetical protein
MTVDVMCMAIVIAEPPVVERHMAVAEVCAQAAESHMRAAEAHTRAVEAGMAAVEAGAEPQTHLKKKFKFYPYENFKPVDTFFQTFDTDTVGGGLGCIALKTTGGGAGCKTGHHGTIVRLAG